LIKQLSGLLGLFFTVDETDAGNDLLDQFEALESGANAFGPPDRV
jgi:hypothetical protein